MSRQNINRGSVANDGTGDTLRTFAQKCNDNFIELYGVFGDSSEFNPLYTFDSAGITVRSTPGDTTPVVLSFPNTPSTTLISFPDSAGTVLIDTASQTITNKTILGATVDDLSVRDASDTYSYDVVGGTLAANRTINLPALTDSDTFVFVDAPQTLLLKTLSSPSLQTPKIVTAIHDTNDNPVVDIVATPGVITNRVSVTNETTGNNPSLSASGADSDITLNITGKGTGVVNIASGLAYQTQVQTTAGAISLSTPLTLFNSGVGIAASLANGVQTGHTKKLINVNTGLVTVTPSTFAQGTSIAMAANSSCELIWAGSSWHLFASQDSDNTLQINT